MPVGKVKTMPNDSGYEDPNLEGEIEKTLQAFDSDSAGSSTPEPPQASAEPSEPTPQEPAAVEDDSTPKATDGMAAEPAEGDTAGEPDATKPAIPDNYYRAAVHSGLSPEQISELYDKDPNVAIQVLGGLYTAQNRLSQQFAQAGRAVRTLEQTKQQEQTVKPQQQPEPGLDLNKLREKYDEDPFGAMVDLVKSLKTQPQIQPQVVQPQGDSADVIAQEKMLAYEQLVDFFSAEDLKAYDEFYGPTTKENRYDWGKLTPGQLANRQAVTRLADEIIAGAEFQGGQISIAEALEKAHLMVSQPISQQIIREQIVSQIKKRDKGITLRPSAGQALPAKGNKGTSETQLEANVQQLLNNMKW